MIETRVGADGRGADPAIVLHPLAANGRPSGAWLRAGGAV